jgi:hypothetical protein
MFAMSCCDGASDLADAVSSSDTVILGRVSSIAKDGMYGQAGYGRATIDVDAVLAGADPGPSVTVPFLIALNGGVYPEQELADLQRSVPVDSVIFFLHSWSTYFEDAGELPAWLRPLDRTDLFRTIGLDGALRVVDGKVVSQGAEPDSWISQWHGHPLEAVRAAIAEVAGSAGNDPPPLATWTWTAAELADGPVPGEIAHVWVLGDALVAAETDQSDEGGGASALLVSTRGGAWQSAPFHVPGFLVESGVVMDGELTLVGNIGPAAQPRRQIWRTRDGVAWTPVEGVVGLGFGPGHVTTIVHADAGWLAHAVERIDAESAAPHLLLSEDRVTWSELEGPDAFVDFASDGRRIVAPTIGISDPVARPDRVAWSDDARSWTEVTVAELAPYDSTGVIAATPDGFALGGQRFRVEDEAALPLGWWSVDGEAWHPSSFESLPGRAGQAAPRWMTGTPDGLIATGDGDQGLSLVWVSDDGRRWQQVAPLPPGTVTAAARDGADVVVAMQSGTSDAILWRGTASR